MEKLLQPDDRVVYFFACRERARVEVQGSTGIVCLPAGYVAAGSASGFSVAFSA